MKESNRYYFIRNMPEKVALTEYRRRRTWAEQSRIVTAVFVTVWLGSMWLQDYLKRPLGLPLFGAMALITVATFWTRGRIERRAFEEARAVIAHYEKGENKALYDRYMTEWDRIQSIEKGSSST